ncbi:MAG: TetR/AcrR family transcriptional regulator [Bacteroidia bacterium]
MASIKTKQKILQSAHTLFNEKGFVNVTLRDIATASEISIGNLAYHYANKSVIMTVLYQQMDESLAKLWAAVNQEPSFANIAQHIQQFHEFQAYYRFFFLDMLEIERAHPEIAAQHQAHIERQITNVKSMIDYAVKAGNMQPELRTGMYTQLAHTVWMMINFWLSQQEIRQQKTQANAVEAIWYLVIPHLTPKGSVHIAELLPSLSLINE